MNTEQKADIKCGKCKTYRYSSDFLNDKNRTMKSCKKCREYSKKSRDKYKNKHLCPHKRLRNTCIDCGGASICEHNRQRHTCVDCGGASICEHKRLRSQCIDCGGASICEHKRLRSQCIECDGSQICEHKRKRSQCKECGGASICEHKRLRNTCKECNDAIKLTIKRMISSSKTNDKKYDRYDADRFIDKCFLEELVEEYPNCYYDDCQIELQYIEYQNNLATIERLDNSIGHIKSNCVLCCLKCNAIKKSNR